MVAFGRLVVAAGYLSGMIFGAIGLIISYDVLAREVLRTPTSWTLETATFLMVPAVFLGGPYAMQRGEHIAVDLLTHRLPPAAARRLLRLTLLLAALLFGVIAVQGALMTHRSMSIGLVSPTIHLPAWIFQATLPIGTAMMAIEAIRQLVASFGARSDR